MNKRCQDPWHDLHSVSARAYDTCPTCQTEPKPAEPAADEGPALRDYWLLKYDYGADKFEIYVDEKKAKQRYEACGEYFPAQLIHVREVKSDE